jgi:hypothetical protein
MKEALGHLSQYGVTNAVTQRVIDHLETVEVEVEDREGSGTAIQPTETLAQAVHQDGSICQSRQWVGSRLALEGDRSQLPIGNISHDRYDQCAVCLVYPSRRRLNGTGGTITAQEPVIRRCAFGVCQRNPRGMKQREIVRMNEFIQMVSF